ncbi:hypothetical protein FACHB389_13750 [Nostoc calcicola FACHB-389]|nr:hypothetical protein [Nostoc calcicola FACHB-3891]OKH35005.1 hypothetical protein FACHB389_13750 [Nostoc calcicola FACHB-389]
MELSVTIVVGLNWRSPQQNLGIYAAVCEDIAKNLCLEKLRSPEASAQTFRCVPLRLTLRTFAFKKSYSFRT